MAERLPANMGKHDFSENYEISNYSYLDQLNDANKIDYSIDFL